jgi:hypothetical protein
MSYAYIPNEDALKRIVHKAVEKAVTESLPSAIRKATRQKWIRTKDVMEILQCSRRQVQFLRDTNRLPYHQHRRSILYNIDEVEAYLNRGRVDSKE